MKKSNVNGVIIFLLSPFIVYFLLFVFAEILLTPFSFLFKTFKVDSDNLLNSQNQSFFLALTWFFFWGFLVVWQVAKRLKKPQLSDMLFFLSITFFTVKGLFKEVPRPVFEGWFSLWIFAPFLLIACSIGKGQVYLKRYLWFPILMDSIGLMINYWRGVIKLERSEYIYQPITIVDLGIHLLLLSFYLLFFVGFVKYNSLTYDPNTPHRYIPTIWFGVPAFTVGLLFTFLFFVMF